MATVALTGKDVFILDERVFSGFGDGDVVLVDFPNTLAEMKTGKNGNGVGAANSSGLNATITIKVLRGGSDDKWLNSRFNQFINDSVSFSMFSGSFVKRIGNGSGNVTDDIYKISGALPNKMPNTKDNTDGDVEQSQSIYVLSAFNVRRSI